MASFLAPLAQQDVSQSSQPWSCQCGTQLQQLDTASPRVRKHCSRSALCGYGQRGFENISRRRGQATLQFQGLNVQTPGPNLGVRTAAPSPFLLPTIVGRSSAFWEINLLELKVVALFPKQTLRNRQAPARTELAKSSAPVGKRDTRTAVRKSAVQVFPLR